MKSGYGNMRETNLAMILFSFFFFFSQRCLMKVEDFWEKTQH